MKIFVLDPSPTFQYPVNHVSPFIFSIAPVNGSIILKVRTYLFPILICVWWGGEELLVVFWG